MRELILTAVGPDRPGIVGELTGKLLGTGANLADSRMVNLRGQFAIIMLVEVPDGDLETARRGIVEAGGRLGLEIHVTAAATSGSGAAATGKVFTGLPYRLKTYAMDQPGIVHRITHLLHVNNVNIEDLQTHLVSGSYSGTPLFTMDLKMTVPANLNIKSLRQQIEDLCTGLNCDAELSPG